MTRSLSSGFFITFEGGEGTGKSTQIARLADHLRARDLDVVTTREPGGSPGAEALRHVLLSGAARGYGEPDLEAVLFAAGRSDHLATLVLPALEKGTVVICDRFHDSTRVYQGLGGSDPALIDFLEHVAIGDLRPDLTIVMDLPAEIGLQRAAERRGGAVPDRFEGDALLVHEARRKAFLAIAANEPQRCIVVDGARSVSEVAKEIAFVVDDRLDDGRLASGSDDTRTFSA